MNWHEGDQRVIHVAVTLITRNKMARMSLPDFCDEPAWARPPVGAVWHFPRGRWWPPLERRRCSSPQMARRRLRNFPKNPEKSRGIPSNGPDISWQHTWHWRPTPGAGAFEFRHWKTSRPAPLRHWLPARPVANALRCRTDKSTPIWNHCQIPSIPFDIFYPFFHTLLPLNFNVDSFPMNFNANLWLCSIVRIKRAERERCGTERCTWPTAAALLPANCEQLKLQACGLGFMKGAQPPNHPTTQPFPLPLPLPLPPSLPFTFIHRWRHLAPLPPTTHWKPAATTFLVHQRPISPLQNNYQSMINSIFQIVFLAQLFWIGTVGRVFHAPVTSSGCGGY